MAEEKMFKAALEAIDQGQTARARDLFTRLLKSNSSKAEYWLWMSTLVESAQERIYCLESALRVDPNNEAAKRGLIILGAKPADKDVTPVQPIHRNWEKELGEVAEPPKTLWQRMWVIPSVRLAIILFSVVVVGGIIIAGVNSIQHQPEAMSIYKVSPFPTRTPEPSITPSPTITGLPPTPTPVLKASTPLWAFLTETYTPVPLYVNTPHPVVEAYRAGIHALEVQDWSSMLTFMLQATTPEPNAPDIYYYLGEAYRMLGNYQEAVNMYGKALSDSPAFAPAYLGRALTYEKIDPKADIEGELNYAVDSDPFYVDAYLTRARVRIESGNLQGGLDDLVIAEGLFPNHPLVYVLRAQALLKMNDLVGAMQNAVAGYQRDKTSLAAYYTLGMVYLASKDDERAIHYIDIYLVYVHDDARGWAVKAQAEYELGRYDRALEACEQGAASDAENAPSWFYCGLAHLAVGDAKTAVNDLVTAVNLDLMNFDYSVWLAKALWADERLAMAIRQFSSAEALATSDPQRAIIYFNRAQVNELAGETTDALLDWANLLALPPDQVPPDWLAFAQERWEYYNPPTATETPTETPVPTSTITPTPTLTPTATRTPTYVHTMVSSGGD